MISVSGHVNENSPPIRLLPSMYQPIPKRLSLPLLLSACLVSSLRADESARAPSLEELIPKPEQIDARLEWWREARFGMFIHWGVYSGLSGTWKGKKYGGYGEHIQRMAKIPISVYHKEVASAFNPTEFNAEQWIQLAKDAGMRYFIITAKHHDGFAMYDSKFSDATVIKATPFKRDPMKELQAACQKHGIKFGFYYSHAFDWGEENGPGNDWDFDNPGGDKGLHGRNWWENYPQFLPKARKYVDEKCIPQLQELIANYDPDIIWFDTPHKLPEEENRRILAAVRKAKPSLVVNGRIVRGSAGNAGDYLSTCDRPAEFPPQEGDWEGIPTTNESYGYNANDRSHKPASHFIQLLAKSTARGGNQLLNIGPMGNGAFDEADVKILKDIAKWWSTNGESIRGATRTPLAPQAWGQSTRKGNRLYLHVFDWPKDGKLVVGGIKTKINKAWLLAEPEKSLTYDQSEIDLTLHVPTNAPDTANSVVVVECVSEPAGDPIRLLSSRVAANTLHVFDGKLTGGLRFGPGKKIDDHVTGWAKKEYAVVWPVRVNDKTTYQIMVNYDAPAAVVVGKIVEGDAGLEKASATQGARGRYAVKVGGQSFVQEVKTGTQVQQSLGTITLEPGNHEVRVEGEKIAGDELMRLRKIVFIPAPLAAGNGH